MGNVVDLPNRRWPNGVIPFVISNDFATAERGIVESGIRHWNERTVINLRDKSTGDQDFVKFVKAAGGCSSDHGRTGNEQEIRCDTGSKATIIHEIGHAVGLVHEHQRKDRDCFLTFNPTPPLVGNLQLIIRTDGSAVGEYDYKSIMHYGPTQDGTTVLVSPFLPAPNERFAGEELSRLDIITVARAYGEDIFESDVFDLETGGQPPTVKLGIHLDADPICHVVTRGQRRTYRVKMLSRRGFRTSVRFSIDSVIRTENPFQTLSEVEFLDTAEFSISPSELRILPGSPDEVELNVSVKSRARLGKYHVILKFAYEQPGPGGQFEEKTRLGLRVERQAIS